MTISIERAIFASVRANGKDGYQVAAQSEAISDEDLRAIALWCPTHDGMLEHENVNSSVGTFILPSGNNCVVQSLALSGDYSGRGGRHIISHCLFLPPNAYTQMACNPFAVVQAAKAAGQLPAEPPSSRVLEPFKLVGRAKLFDRYLVERVVETFGSEAFLGCLDRGLREEPVAFASEQAEELINGMWQCLPPPFRQEISVATALNYSPRRQCRWLGVDTDRYEIRRLVSRHQLDVIDLTDRNVSHSPEQPLQWTKLIGRYVSDRAYADLERLFKKCRRVDSMHDLEAFAGKQDGPPPQRTNSSQTSSRDASTRYDGKRRHRVSYSTGSSLAVCPKQMEEKATHSMEVTDRLEALDDVIFAAIRGDQRALEEARDVWNGVVAELGPDAVEESREQYLRYAMTVWSEERDTTNARPETAAAALEIITLISGANP